VIIASYSRGTAMIEHQAYYEGWYYNFTVEPAYVVDHFGAAGGQAVIDWREEDLLTVPNHRAIVSLARWAPANGPRVPGRLPWSREVCRS
jgi:hypothetical protein